ncbi:NUDIX domain family protein [Candida parapsilosis]|uniref:Nudix hydrolase domain-containing protein n=2 Tax=Candida parapsilosis TaxID=5480 RepID=G8B7E6_CANPC|nr:uncharacterized protein CPAR2_104170 [Candida parapsilosis]KAF6048360.1 NUDIX domain family protein [Candida parapsilosis]KAF6049674.1 NUDIX domain family protein [Candida parapsilosis]KAF6057536.1 NUDIX domain family protein [Candida parapsilosis]KAF6065756.1 NUDIX domain family protein [Candida parapsilosis]KAI5905154.1 Uncharacterized protein K4G60_g4412 [Candida parapsilosis]
MSSFLSVIEEVDSFKKTDAFYTFLDHEGRTALGYIDPNVVELLQSEPTFVTNHETKTIAIDSQFDTLKKRNEMFAEVANRWRVLPELDEILNKGWRNELYVVYNPSKTPYAYMERAFSVLFGVVTYGVHINGYVPPELSSNGKLKLYIPRRSKNKSTFPGMLDNTVAGGIGYPHGLETTIIKECFEEAGLEEDFVRKNIKNTGVLTYIYLTDDGRAEPEVEYICDIIIKEDEAHLISPQDGEAEDFKLMDIDEVLKHVENRAFKPNCGLVIVDFLIRHGYITAESEPDYLEIVSRCHVKLPFPTR